MFIVIEGPDGSGKTTLAKQLTIQLNQANIPTIYTYEPTRSSSAGKRLRSMMHKGNITNVYEFADLFAEDRKIHVETIIAPALAKGENVVCDRYKYSAMIYQQLQGVDTTYLAKLGQQCLVPDMVYVLIPVNVDILLSRIITRGKKLDVFEESAFLQDAIELYRRLPEYFPQERVILLDASTKVQDSIDRILRDISCDANLLSK